MENLKQTIKMKNFSFKDNDAFDLFKKLTQRKDIEQHIMEQLFERFEIPFDDCFGHSIQTILDDEKIDPLEFVQQAFPTLKDHSELVQILPSVIFFGTGENPCPECGCELDVEHDGSGSHSWTNINCTFCDYGDTDEPNWDSMPGGHDDY